MLARLKRLRGTPFDLFGYHPERRTERQLLADYEAVLAELAAGLNADNHDLAVRIASIPEQIRGYSHVKDRTIATAKAEAENLLTAWRQQGTALVHHDGNP
jgi:indolepyruvate ferredoxin oxidoreductase